MKSRANLFNPFAKYTEDQYNDNMYGLKDKFSSYSDYLEYRNDIELKMQATRLKRYGTTNCGFGSNNYKQSIINKYGVDNPNKNKDIITKRKATNVNKYGNEWGNVDKRRSNYKERTGYENPYSNPEVIKKRSDDYYNKTGYYYPGQNPEVKAKIELTRLAKYPYLEYKAKRPLYLHENGKTSSKFEIYIDNLLLENFPDLDFRFNDRTMILNPKTNRHLELDIFIPSLNKAIEIGCGYFHKDKDRDKFKIEECNRLGIELLNIDYYEFYSDEDKSKSIITEFINTPNKFMNSIT